MSRRKTAVATSPALNGDVELIVALSDDQKIVGWFMTPEIEAEFWEAVWREADSEFADQLRSCRKQVGLKL